MDIFFIFLFGLVIGSFLNVVIYRLPREISFSKGRSGCASCGHQLKWYDLLPLFSYLCLLGKCRYCKAKISAQYPLVELLTGVLYAGAYHIGLISFDTPLKSIILLTIISFIVVGVFTDFLYHGTFDFSTVWVCALFFVYYALQTGSLMEAFKSFFASLSFLVVIAALVWYVSIKQKGKMVLAILLLLLILMGSICALLIFTVDVTRATDFIVTVINWFSISIFIFIADYTIKKIFSNNRVVLIGGHVFTWFNFVSLFLFLFNMNSSLFSLQEMMAVYSFSFKNAIIVILFTLFYMFQIELFATHDNNEDIIEDNDEIIDRDENMFTSLIGDGDLFILPFVGMVLGYWNVFNFYTFMGVTVLCVYTLTFRKGVRYTIPLYPYIVLSTILLL